MLEADVALQLRQVHWRLSQMMREKVSEYGLTFRLLHITILIAKNPNISQKELAERMGLTPGAVSMSVKKLIKLGMLKQIPLEEDLRYNRLVVTQRAEAIMKDYEEDVISRYKELFTGFSEHELQVFSSALVKVNANLDRMARNN